MTVRLDCFFGDGSKRVIGRDIWCDLSKKIRMSNYSLFIRAYKQSRKARGEQFDDACQCVGVD